MKRLVLLIFLISLYQTSQATCTYRDSFKPTTTSACSTYRVGPYAGLAQFCSSTGFTGFGNYSVFKVCTDSNASCINLTISPVTLTGNMEILVYTGCASSAPIGYISDSYKCLSGSGWTYNTEGLGLAPNTCYAFAMWTKDTGTFQICRQLNPRPADDTCLGAITVPYVSGTYNTSCYTHDPAKEPNNSCVSGVLKKSRWYKHTLTCDTFARFYFSNMNCIGGSGAAGTSGYHISYFSGTCASLGYLGCSSGTGGTFNTTVSGLSIGQTIYILVNGNYGSNCSYELRVDTPVVTKNVTLNTSICSGKSIIIGGISRTAAGTYKDTTYKVCNSLNIIDSIRTFNLTIRPTSTITIDTSICQGKSIFFKGQNRTTAGTYRDTLVKVNGCDSIRILNLTIRSTSTKIIDTQICQGQSIFFNGLARSNSGTYLDTLINFNNCDSFLTLNLTVHPTPTTSIFDTICQGGSRFFNGLARTTAGVYNDTLFTSKNCDSFIALNLFVKSTSIKTIDTSICQGKSIFFKGLNRTTAGTYRDTLINSKGCDSFIILNLTIKNTSTTNLSSSICQGGSIFFKGLLRTATGVYRDTLINSAGCDSFVILNLTIKPHSFTTLNTQICLGQSVFFNAVARTSTGSYLDTLTSANGCDSFITLNLTVNPTPTATRFDTICQGSSIFFNGLARTTSGIYRDTLVTAKNCDSFIILNLNVKTTSTKTIDTSICQGKSYFFKGQNRTTAGTYRDTLVNSKGCDSFAILNLTIKNTSSTNLNSNICQGSSIFFKGQNRTTTGIYRDTLTNIGGCDSFSTLNLTVLPINTTNLNISICTGNSYFFKGQNRTISGTYRDTVKTSFNCDSFIVLNLNVFPSLTRTIDTSICQGKSIFFKGQNRTVTGTYRDTIVNPSPSCDSIITLNLTVKNTSTRNLFDTLCQGQSVLFKGLLRTTTGIYRDTLVNSVGCDSFVILNLLVKASPIANAGPDTSRVNCSTDSVRIGAAAIAGYSYLWLPNTGLSSNTVAQPWAKPTSTTIYILEVTLTTTGCKMRDTMTLNVLPSTVNASIRKYLRTCKGATGQSLGGTPTASSGTGPYTYIWTPNLYLSSNTIANPTLTNTQHGNYSYVVQVTDSKGCIARDTTIVVIDSLPINAAGRDTNICRNAPLTLGKTAQNKISYSWNPTTGLSSGTISNPTFNSASTGSYNYILTLADSTNTCILRDTLTIQVHPQKFDTLRPSICAGQSYFFNGAARTASGTYFQTATTAKGCDSFIVLYLTVNNTSTKTIDSQICQGKSVFFKGQNRTTTGTYRDTLLNSKNCDSVITLNLTINPTPTTNINLTICQGTAVNFKGIPRTTTGIYRDTLLTSKSCDSFVILNLTVSPKTFKTIDTAICRGKSYFFKGLPRSANATILDTLINAAGCDSVITLNLTIKDTSTNIIRDTICKNFTRFFNGNLLNSTGIYKDTLVNAKGCDSFLYLHLHVKDTSSRQLYDTICSNQFRNFNGVNRNATGIYKDTLINAKGCDSFVYLNLIVKPTSSSTFNVAICSNQSYFFKGQNRNSSGTYRDTIPNARGCDSFMTLNLIVNALSFRTIDTTICRGQSFFFKGQNQITAGTYRDTLLNSKGCDSFATLILAFKDTSRYVYSDTICKNQPILFNGQWRDVTGIYRDTLTNAVGCDSFVSLNLLVYNNSTQILRDTICSNKTYFFKGQNLNTTGTYRDTFSNGLGCDSFVILNLFVQPTTSSTRTVNICQGQSYTFKGRNETTAGTYYDTLLNKKGCDSFVTLILNVNPLPIANAGADITRVNCDGDSVRLGTNPNPIYSYLWTPYIGLESASIANPYSKTTSKTIYELIVTNNITGCQARDTVVVDTQNSQLTGSATVRNLRCHNDFSGQINIQAANGYAPYNYKVTAMNTDTSSNIIPNLSATPSAIYTIKDNKGCLFSGAFIIEQPDSISIRTIVKSDLKCFNDNTGKIEVKVAGGISPYRYVWDRHPSTDSLADKLASGIHMVTVRDDSLCLKPHRVELFEPSPLILLDTIKYPNPCFGDTLGKLKALAGGGTEPYYFKWSNGRTTQLIDKLSEGTYQLTIEDKNQCRDSFQVVLTDPKMLRISSSKEDLNCNDNGEIRIKAFDGTPPYIYSISGGINYKKDSLFRIHKSGEYKLAVLDRNLCPAQDSVIIGLKNLIKIKLEPNNQTIGLGEQVQLGFKVIEGDSTQIQNLRWSPSIGLRCTDCAAPIASPYSTETYVLDIVYAGECEVTDRVKIIVESKDELYIPSAFYPLSDQPENRTFKIYSNNILRATLAIYNRWGEKVYESSEPHRTGWNGEYKGELLMTGVFYYHLDLTYLDGRKVIRKGDINLIR